MSDTRAAIIKAATAAVKKAFKGSITDVASRSLEFPSVFASTGSLSLDRLCAGGNPGGIPIGRRYGCIVHIAGEWSTGKALWSEETVLTPRGFVRAGDIRLGDSLIGSNGRSTSVTSVWPQGERQLYRVAFSDGATVVVDGDHMWSVKSPNDFSRHRPWRTLTTKEILSGGLRTRLGTTWAIPVSQAVVFTESAPLEIPAYIMGVLLGDGCLSRLAGVEFANADAGVVAAVKSQVDPRLDVVNRGYCAWRIVFRAESRKRIHPYSSALAMMGLRGKRSWEKFIPLQYLNASVEDRTALLRGLLDTDGSIDKHGSVSYSSTSRVLAEGVRDLVLSLGGLATISHREASTYAHPTRGRRSSREHWNVGVIVPFAPFLGSRRSARVRARTHMPRRKIVAIEQAFRGDAVCFIVDAPDSLFVMSSYVVTHNSVVLDEIFRSVLVDHKGLAKCTETEGTRTPHFMQAIGLPMDLLSIDRPDTFETAFDMFEEWHEVVRKQDPTIPVVWGFDSLDSTEAAKSADKTMSGSGGWHFGGGRAEALGAGLRRVAKICSRYPTTMVMLNQTRDNVGVMFGPKKRTPGGSPPHFYSSVELMLSGSPRPGKGFVRAETPMPKLDQTTIKRLGLYNLDDTAVLGRYVRAKVTKTKMATTLDTTADFYINFRTGLHRWEGLLERMVAEGVVGSNGDMSEFTMAAADKPVDGEERMTFKTKKDWLNFVVQNPSVLSLERAEAMKK